MEDKFMKHLESDEVFSQFTTAEFDAKTHATRIIQSHAISQQLAKLAEGINLLDRQLHSQVVAHHEDLLSQATGIETLDGVLHMMQTRIQSLLLAVERIRSRVVEPYNKIVTRTMQLRRLQETCDLLRHIIRMMYLSKRLHSQLQGGSREITKAAQSLSELDYMSSTVDLSGIEVIDADRRFIKQAHKDVELQANKMLQQGIESQNQTQAATALQVFLHLGSLRSTVERIMAAQKERLLTDIKSSLDVNALTQPLQLSTDRRGVVPPGRASGISLTGNTASFRAALWTNLDKLVDNVYVVYSQVLHLQKVLMRKRDPVTHVVFIDLLTDSQDEARGVKNLVQDLWVFICASLTHELSQTADSNTFLRQVLDGEYPKLVRLYSELWRRIQSLGGAALATSLDQMSVGACSDADSMSSLLTVDNSTLLLSLDNNGYDGETALRDSLSQFETAYLSKSLSRLIDPINLVFSSSSASPPTDDEIDGVVKVIASEWSVTSIDSRLAVSMSKNIAKTVVFFCTKSEQMLVTDTDSSCQVIGPVTSAQTVNAGVVNSLYKFHQAISKVLSQDVGSSLPEAATLSFHEALQSVVQLMAAAVQPLIDAVGHAMEAVLLTMHDEDFSQSGVVGSGVDETRQCSLYMKELDQFVSRAASTYLAQFVCTDFIIHSLRPVVCRSIDLFVQHTSLLCPLSDAGKLRLAADYAQLESCMTPLCHKLTDLGRPFRMIRAIRPVLFQSTECLASSDVIGDVIPYSIALHLLYTRAHPDIKPPYQSLGWSLTDYCDWLEQHTAERDRLALIKGSLEAYVQSVTSRGGKEFSPVYPVMLQLLQRAMQQLHD